MIQPLRRLFHLATGRSTAERDIEDELRLHLTLLIEELIATGLEPSAAEAEARRRLGDWDGLKRDCEALDHARERAYRRAELLDHWRRDLRHALRRLSRAPGFTAVAVLTFALGIGANTTIFSVLNAVLLRPLPYPGADRLVMVWQRNQSGQQISVSGPTALDWRAQARSFSALAAFGEGAASLVGGGIAERVTVAAVTQDFFSVMGMAPLRGRAFDSVELQSGSPVVLGEGLWRRRFGADPKVLDSTIRLDGAPHTVVGIMPAALDYPDGAEAWAPLGLERDPGERSAHNWAVIARLRPGVHPEQAEAELNTLAARDAAGLLESAAGMGASVVPLQRNMAGGPRSVEGLLLLQAAVLLVLLIACVNVTNLMLARATVRQDEIALTLALGAEPRHIVRRLVSESLLVAVGGGVAGVLIALWAGRLLQAALPGDLPFIFSRGFGLDHRVLLFAIGATLLTGFLAGLIPALAAVRRARLGTAVASAALAGRVTRRLTLVGVFVGVEVALAVTLLVGAGLILKSLARLQGVDPGFRPGGVATLDVNLPAGPGARYATPEARVALLNHLTEDLDHLPGVRAVGAISSLPLLSYSPNGEAMIEGRPSASGGERDVAHFRVVGPGYFGVLGIPILRGRDFTAEDRSGAPYVALMNQAMVTRYFRGVDPLGRRIRWPGMDGMDDAWATIVGVVGDVRHVALFQPSVPEVYYSYHQRPARTQEMFLVIRSDESPSDLVPALRATLARVDREIPFLPGTMSGVLARSTGTARLATMLLGGFAALALFLSAIGIFGVVAFSVAQRAREVGIRLALGADSGRVLWFVVTGGMAPVGAGLLVGIAIALGAGRMLRGLLFEIPPTDSATFAGVVGLMTVVGLLACLFPALRAARADPMIALRAE